MAIEVEFRYFPDYLTWASFADQPCPDCPDEPCFVGSYFDHPSDPETVCLSSLLSGEIRSDVEGYLETDLANSMQETFPTMTAEQVKTRVAELSDELSHTPPIPWIQNNQWPSCHGDFCRYLGEWNQERLIAESPDGDGKTYLISILDSNANSADWIDNVWNAIAVKWSFIFTFECFTCGRRIAIDQSF